MLKKKYVIDFLYVKTMLLYIKAYKGITLKKTPKTWEMKKKINSYELSTLLLNIQIHHNKEM